MRARRLRAFTLVELVTYLALVTSAGVVIGGLELAASRAAFLERALVEIAFRADLLGTHFRSDLRQARRATWTKVPAGATRGTLLVVVEASGEEARYEIEDAKKIETREDGGKTTVHAESARLLRTLRPSSGAEVVLRETTGEVASLDLVREVQGSRSRYVLSVVLVASRGDEIPVRRSFVFSGSAVAEEAP